MDKLESLSEKSESFNGFKAVVRFLEDSIDEVFDQEVEEEDHVSGRVDLINMADVNIQKVI